MKKEDIGGYVFLAISIIIYIIIGGWDFALWVAELVNYDSDDYSLWEKLSYNWSLYCLLYTSPSPRDGLLSRMPSSA